MAVPTAMTRVRISYFCVMIICHLLIKQSTVRGWGGEAGGGGGGVGRAGGGGRGDQNYSGGCET